MNFLKKLHSAKENVNVCLILYSLQFVLTITTKYINFKEGRHENSKKKYLSAN